MPGTRSYHPASAPVSSRHSSPALTVLLAAAMLTALPTTYGLYFHREVSGANITAYGNGTLALRVLLPGASPTGGTAAASFVVPLTSQAIRFEGIQLWYDNHTSGPVPHLLLGYHGVGTNLQKYTILTPTTSPLNLSCPSTPYGFWELRAESTNPTPLILQAILRLTPGEHFGTYSDQKSTLRGGDEKYQNANNSTQTDDEGEEDFDGDYKISEDRPIDDEEEGEEAVALPTDRLRRHNNDEYEEDEEENNNASMTLSAAVALGIALPVVCMIITIASVVVVRYQHPHRMPVAPKSPPELCPTADDDIEAPPSRIPAPIYPYARHHDAKPRAGEE